MTKKRAPGAGRPPKGEFRGKTATLTTRITPAVRAGLEREAAKNGRSLSQEVEKRLATSLVNPQKTRKEWGESHVLLLARLVSRLTIGIELSTQKRWHEDRFTADAVRAALDTVVTQLASQTDPQIPPALEKMAKDLEDRSPDHGELADSYRKPAKLGVAFALGITTTHMLYNYPPVDRPRNEHYGDGFFLMPKIREILGSK
jgi:hypothetical protein